MSSVASPIATADAKSPDFAGIFVMLAPHLAALDRFLHEQLATFEPEIRAMAEECIDTSGQRIRPALVFLSGWRGPGQIPPDLVRVAAVVELVHLATRVHDDIMDEDELRRRRAKAPREYGPTPAVLLGDVLFAHGLHLPTQFSTTEICAAVTEATRRVCAGEILQTLRRGSANVTRADYQRIVDLKTAELFRVSGFLGARLAGAEPGYVEAASRFGRHFGIAYQLCDELTDFLGEEARAGARPASELASARLTLPLLLLRERLPPPAIYPALAATVQSELAAAAAALREWPGHPATPLLLELGEALQARLEGLRPAGRA